MISLIADTLTFSSIRQLAELVAWAVPALEIIAALLHVVWLVLLLSGETVVAMQKLNRRAPTGYNDL